MIITLLNMQLLQTSRNATPAEENLTPKQWKSTKRFAKKFSQKNAKYLTCKNHAKAQTQRETGYKMNTNTEKERNLFESRLSLQSSRLVSNPAKCPSGNCRVCSLDKLWATVMATPAQRTSTQVKQLVSHLTTELTASGAAASLMNKQATGIFLSASRNLRQIR